MSDRGVKRVLRRASGTGLTVLAVLAGSVLGGFGVPRPVAGAVLPPAPTEAAEMGGALDELAAVVGALTEGAEAAEGPRGGETAERRGSSGAAPSVEVDALVVAYERLRAADLLFRERLAVVEARLRAIGASQEIFDRFASAESRYDASIRSVLGPLDEVLTGPEGGGEGSLAARTARLRTRAGSGELSSALAAVRAALDGGVTTASPEILRAAVFPYGRLTLAQRSPAIEPLIQPAYLDATDPGAASVDLAPSPLAPLSEAILVEAERLDHDLVRIYERVRSGIRTEWYAGSMKGAEETLRQGSGNDADQAALLVALLRASGIPARYVRGVSELSPDEIADDLGLEGAPPERIAEALQRAGVAFRPVVRGGRVAAFEVEQVWVAARIPYTNYRGAVVDLSGPTWLPLAPAVSVVEGRPSAAVLQAMAAAGELSAEGFVEESLSAFRVADPLSVLRSRVIDYLDRTGGGSYEESLGAREPLAESLGLLPSSLPFPVTAVSGEWPALPDELVHRVRFVVRGPAEGATPALLDWTAPVAEVAGRRITLSYVPATVEDQRVVNAFGGLGAVPLYLVRLRPQVKVDGRPRAVGTGDVDAGRVHRLEIELLAPAGTERVTRQVTAGSYYALALGAQSSRAAEPDSVSSTDPADTESEAARLLAGIGFDYGTAWDDAEDELAGLAGVAVLRPLPSLSIVGNAVAVETVLGLPEQLRWQGVTLDAALRAAEPVATPAAVDGSAAGATGTADTAERGWLALSALQGSALEHRVFEQGFLVDAVSADKGLGLARQAGVEILRLTPEAGAADLSALDHPAAVRAEVERWLRLGMEVEVPRSTIVRGAWQGSVWRVIDPQGRGAGYFIAGSLTGDTSAGGATTEPPGSWVNDFLAQVLASPYAPTPNLDPLAAAEVVKIPATDRQVATVGETYGVPLAVLVRDADGRPVAGAPVTFEAWSGEGSFVQSDGSSSPSILVQSGPLGIASVRFRSGTKTDREPIYTLRSSTDAKPTRALVNLVEVSVLSSHGSLSPTAPFELVAYPGPVDHLRRTDTDQSVFYIRDQAGLWVDTIKVAAEDRYGNPVSNVLVYFTVGEITPFEGCANGETGPIQNAVVFDPALSVNGTVLACPSYPPMLGTCGGPSQSGVTGVSGAAAGVILGSSLVTSYQVSASVGGVEELGFEYRAVFDQFEPNGDCATLEGFRVFAATATDEQGNNIQAARPGALYRDRVRMTFLYPLHEVDVVEESTANGTRYSLKRRLDFEWVPVPAVFDLQVENGGSATPPQQEADLVYSTLLTTGTTPGYNRLQVEAHDFDFPVWEVSQLTGTTYLVTHKASEFIGTLFSDPILRRPVTGVWGVLPRLLTITPDPPVLGPSGQTTEEVVVGYGIEPFEYRAKTVEVDLLEDGVQRGTSIGDLRQAGGFATVQRGFPFDVDRTYELELVLNRGSESEVRSNRAPLRLFQRILEDVTASVYVDQDVDLVNGRSCDRGGDFRYTLTQEAQVTLEVRSVDGVGTDGSLELGAAQIVIGEVLQAEGEKALTLGPDTLLPGDYRYTLRAVSAADGRTEEVQGTIRSEYRVRDALPVGHTLVQGVDLWDGHLALSREDLSYPGRGVALAFRRSYSSNAGTEPGPMGIGWSHNYESRVVVTPCGEAIVVGGEGSGMRFVDDGEGGLRPLKGYHGTLIADAADGSFVFYAKGGTRYRYALGYGREVYLDSIEDPNGNTTRLIYETGTGGRPRLSAVVDPAGRKLTFHYAPGQFALLEDTVLVQVDGPEGSGQSIRFDYDTFGNLTRAEREGASRAESYAYATGALEPFEDRHVLVSVTDEVGGGETSYERTRGSIRATADVVVPSTFYVGVTQPEGGRTAFEYDLAGLGDRQAPELVTRVTDPRHETTVYRLNRYGSPVSITDPLGHETSMTWAADDVVMTSRTDANGVTTTFDYDTFGNLLAETVTFPGPDGGETTLTRSFTYHPPAAFEAPFIKDRLARRTDRKGAVTRFAYDARGNLVEQRTAVAGPGGGGARDLVTSHTYLANGDRATSTDPRGETTRLSYDGYGNLASVTDPVGATTSTTFDIRSLPVEQTDPLGRVTRFEYDSLGRPVRRTLPRTATESAAPEETFVYDDGAHTLTQTDAAGRVTVTTTDLEGRVARIDNGAGGTKLFSYDPAGNKTLETAWFDGSTPRVETTFVYDAAGRLTERREPLHGNGGRTTSYAYDPVGNLVRETLFDRTDPGFAPRVTESAYDGLNRKVEERQLTDSGPVVVQTRYDGAGNPVRVTDPLGRVTETELDALDRPIRVRGPEGRETVNVYDGAGNLVEERRLNEVDGAAADQVRTFTYDGAGRLVRQTDALGQSSHLEYDLAGNVVRQIDRRLNVTSHTYDERNRRVRTVRHLTRVTSPGRQVVTELSYDAVGNLTGEHLPNGNVVRHTYDALDRRIRTEDSLGLVAAATYDARGNQVTATDANGNVTTTTYDALDWPARVELPPVESPRVIERTFDVAGNTLSETGPRGNTTTFTYDRLDRPVRTTAPEPFGYTTETIYDAVGNVLATTDGRGNTTTYEYDGLNRLIRSVAPAPLSYETTYTYDRVGNRLSETDPRGVTTETRYDLENRPVLTRRAGLVIEQVEYDAEGNRRFVTDANGTVSGFEYDERNLLTAENLPLAAITRYTLDDMGDVVARRDPEGRVTTFAYDARLRLISETDPADATTTWSYDGNGNRTSTTRPEANAWTYRYDGADRLVEVEDPDGGLTSYTYDGNGNRVTQTDALDQTTRFEYDELDRQTATVYADGARETWTYDENGNQTGQTDAKGQVTTWEYDVLDRETLRTYGLPTDPAGPTGDDLASIATEYDPNGNRTRVTETYTGATGTRLTERTYDLFDRLETVTDPHGEILTYAYDANGNRTGLTDPDGNVTRYTFDALNRPTGVTNAGGVTEYVYLRDSRLSEVRYPNGTTTTQTYDAAGRTATIENRQGTNLVSSYLCEYDTNGNRTRQVEDNGAGPEETTYVYDLLDRLVESHYPEKTVTHTYDAAGNRLTEQALDRAAGTLIVDRVYTYDERNRLLALTDRLAPDGPSSGSVDYTYDANGNQTRRTKAGVTTTFRYSVRDRLIEVREGGALTGSYLYDHQGLRVAKRAGTGETVRYVYDDQSVLLQTDLVGTTLAKYDYGPDRLLSLEHALEGRQYYLFDALGSVVNLTDAAGAIQARYIYDAWGNHRRTAGQSPNPFGFTGHERDDETGLYYAKARYYDPELGLFLTQDPFEGVLDTPPSLHRYLYAFGNPTVYVDPTGQCVFGLPCPEAAENALLVAGAAVEAVVETGVTVTSGVAQGAVNTADFVTAGTISGVARGAGTLIGNGGTLVERVEAAGEEGRRRQLEVLTVGFSEAEDKEAYARQLVSEAFAVERFEAGAQLLAEGIVEGDFETALRGGAEILGGASQVTLTVAGAAEGAQRFSGGLSRVRAARTPRAVKPKAAIIGEDTASVGTGVRQVEVTRTADAALCFVARTPVATADGPRPIEEVQVGDLVLAKDEVTGEVGLHEVVQLFVTPDREVLDLTIETADGTAETLGVTPAHPFWVEGLGWVKAGELQSGDRLTTAEGEVLRVVATEARSTRETVYNLEVAEVHTYFAGQLRAWVHNECRAGVGQSTRTPSSGSLKNPSGNLDEATSGARAQPRGSGGSAARGTTGFVDDVEVTSFGKVVGRGTVDVRATVEGIESGALKPRAIFENKEGLLPKQATGYYEEFVQPTPGVSGVGPQRIVRGQGGELYYTPDHYKTFIPLS